MSQDKKEFRIKALKIRSELSFRAEKDCKIRQKVIKLLSGIKSDSLFFYLSVCAAFAPYRGPWYAMASRRDRPTAVVCPKGQKTP